MATLRSLPAMLFALLVAASAAADDLDARTARLTAGSDLTPVVKKFDPEWVRTLTDRGEPLVYTRKNSEDFKYIGMPIGGICAGQLYLGGDGKLWFWDIFNTNERHGTVRGEETYEFPYHRDNLDDKGIVKVDQGFAVRVRGKGIDEIRTLDRDGWKNITFLGQYPVGEVTYKDEAMPIDVELQAFSPFVPLSVDDSSLPATVLRYTVTNTSDAALLVELAGWTENFGAIRSRSKSPQPTFNNRISESKDAIRLSALLTNVNDPAAMPDYGSGTLSALGDGLPFAIMPATVAMPKGVFEHLPAGAVDRVGPGAGIAGLNEDSPVGVVGRGLSLAPGKSATVAFVLTWHFPNSQVATQKVKRGDPPVTEKRYYAKRFKSADDVADHVLGRLDELTRKTLLWRDTWYDSTLPYWFLDRTFLNASILASNTCHLFEDGRFYGFEGGYQGPGTCTHVWGYVHAPGRLFPQLERSLREHTDFSDFPDGGFDPETGLVGFRGRWRMTQAVDGQSGVVLRSLLTHQMSTDDSFLKKYYPRIKACMQQLTESRDADHDGILTGSQHNTLDGNWWGKVTWLSLHYGAALRAMAVMADEVGDDAYAAHCRTLADRGRRFIESDLFNGQFFFHIPDPENPNKPGLRNGCEYSQLLGQSWAYQVGLGQILDPGKVTTALDSLWRYNFTTDVGPYRKIFTGGRWYAMPGEGGLVACTWPIGGVEAQREAFKHDVPRHANYNNECQNGYEYAATSLWMWHGMPLRSLAHTRVMHEDRYHGSKRNPWCEIEWGMHYSRSMASYGLFTAACGFEHHGPKGYVGFSPRITPDNFKAAFTSAAGWGTFSQRREDGRQTERIEVKYGRLKVKTLAFDLPEGASATSVAAALDDAPLDAEFAQECDRVVVTLASPVIVETNKTLNVVLSH